MEFSFTYAILSQVALNMALLSIKCQIAEGKGQGKLTLLTDRKEGKVTLLKAIKIVLLMTNKYWF